MAEKEKLKSIKRFGARYGRTTKHKFGIIETEQRKKHDCPYCNARKVKRIAVGIWACRKCGAKFTGKAYSVKKKIAPVKSKGEVISRDEATEVKEEAQDG